MVAASVLYTAMIAAVFVVLCHCSLQLRLILFPQCSGNGFGPFSLLLQSIHIGVSGHTAEIDTPIPVATGHYYCELFPLNAELIVS